MGAGFDGNLRKGDEGDFFPTLTTPSAIARRNKRERVLFFII